MNSFLQGIIGIIVGMGGIKLILWLWEIVIAKWIKPFFMKQMSDTNGEIIVERWERAVDIAQIADDITDYIVTMFPDQKWDDYLNEAIDKLIKQLGLSEDTAKRVAVAALARKKDKGADIIGPPMLE